MKKQKIAVFFGGMSTEHEVSLISATTVIKHLNHEKYEIAMIGITKEGRFLHYTGDVENISSGEWEKGMVEDCVISTNRNWKGFLSLTADGWKLHEIDCAIPVLHGKNGEDGTIQGMLELAGIPFVGCDLASSANCMDKQLTHIILEQSGVKMAKWMSFVKGSCTEESYCRVEEYLGYPVFVKPAKAGSSFGVSKASDREQLIKALELAFEHDDKVVVEEMIVGREVECAVLGNQSPKASVAGEIEACNEFYDFDAKYVNSASNLYIPARISEESMQKLRDTAVSAYQAIGCSGLSRVDFFVTEQGEVILNEINTFPGFTSISMYPKLWEHMGVPITELLDSLINLGLEAAE